MIDTATPRGKLIAAALKRAETEAWDKISLADIADTAGMPLDEVRRAFGSKSQILAAFLRSVDDEVLKRASTKIDRGARRDALFEVIMSRFDVLAPYKAAVRSIAKAAPADTTLLMPYLNTQRWMLTAAGIDADGPSGLIRTGGLGSLYASVFRTWLDDDDPGLARTMAALDRRLRRAESTIRTVDNFAGGAVRIVTDLPGVFADTLGRIFKRSAATPTDTGRADASPANPLAGGPTAS